MERDEVEALILRWQEAFQDRNPAALATNYAENVVLESPSYGTVVGRVAVQRVLTNWFASFPDVRLEPGDILIGCDHAVRTSTMTGTDTGGFLGQPPTGRPFRLFVIQWFQVRNGEIVHEHRVFDINGLLMQLARGQSPLVETSSAYRTALAAARLEHDIAVAAEIQRTLFPPPHYAGVGFEVAASSVPCRAIGGDFLDYFHRSDGTFGFVLGDVEGKGPPAALLAAKIQGILAAYSTVAPRPADVLNRANEEVLRRTVESRFATILYGLLGPDGSFTYCNAGHNPPLVIGRRGLRRLETGGMILGAFDSVRFEEETVMLDAGDVLIAFSDGVTEALNREGIEFGEERLVSSITTLQSPKALLERLLTSVRDFTRGTDPSDDVTVLVLRYTGRCAGV